MDLLTKTDNFTRPHDRRYPVTGSNEKVANRWGAQRYPYGRANSMSFNGGTLRSYSTCIARRVESLATGKSAILITTRSYSATTSTKHMPPVRRAAAATGLPVFCVYDPTADARDDHQLNAVAMLDEIRARVKTSLRSKKYRDHYAAQSRLWIGDLLQYSAFVGLDLFPDPTMPFEILLDWFQDNGHAELAAGLRKLCEVAVAA